MHFNAFFAFVFFGCAVVVQVLRFFANQRVHRVAIVDKADVKHIVGVVTQSAIVRFLYRQRELLRPMTLSTTSHVMKKLGRAKPLVTLSETSSVGTRPCTLAGAVSVPFVPSHGWVTT